MFRQLFKKILLSTGLALFVFTAVAQNVAEPANRPPDWSKPYKPFRIAGNLYYVGTYELASYLIVTPKGNILINTGLANSASLIKKNVETLGFKMVDTKILLTTQAHYDHLGAMAAIKKSTGAQMMVDEKDASVLADGGSSDYALGGNGSTFEPVKADRLLKDGDTIELGGQQLVMLHHPGHTKGSCSFILKVKDKARSWRVLIANMPSIVTGKKFSEVTEYPGITSDYAYTLGAMKKLKFDLWFASHASQFDLHAKRKPGAAYNPAVFMDRKGYDTHLNDLVDEFLEKTAAQ